MAVDAPSNKLRLAVLISGGGRTLVNLQEHILAGSVDASIEVVVSSHGDAKGVERSQRLGLPTTIIAHRALGDGEFQRQLTAAVSGVDLVCMAGFLCLWRIPDAMSGRVINIHPALLPAFGGKGMYGRRVHEAVLAAGATRSGCTVHYCDNEYDHGPIIMQRDVEVLPGDTADALASRVFEQECIAYPQAVSLIAQGSVRLDEFGTLVRSPSS